MLMGRVPRSNRRQWCAQAPLLDVILSVTGAFPIAEGHHFMLCWLSIAVGSCEGKEGEGQWEGGSTQCHIAVHTGYRNLQRVPHSALRPHIVEVHTGWHI